MTLTIERGRQWPREVERLLLALPEWFGQADSNAAYVQEAERLPTVAARDGGTVVGVCLVRPHSPESAEVELLAVDPTMHRAGIGTALLEAVEQQLVEAGVRLLQVKTFGPSGDSEEYERTRAFYRALGFIPLEERTDIWGPDDPCLISVKVLG